MGLPKIYEPKAGSVPYITSMVGLPNLEELTFNHFPHGLLDLREGFKKLGYREQERKITYALKHSETLNSIKNSLKSEHKNYYKWVEGQLNLYLFEYTSNWGMSPGRPLFILLSIMFLFSFVYMFSLIGINNNDGIWKVWIKDRVRSDLGEAESKNPLIFREHSKFGAMVSTSACCPLSTLAGENSMLVIGLARIATTGIHIKGIRLGQFGIRYTVIDQRIPAGLGCFNLFWKAV